MSKLGKYEIRRELGKGAMGVVYEGFDPVIQRTVAIKTILPAALKGEEASDILARFKREAQAAGRLNHPGIVAVYDYGEETISDDHTMVANAQTIEAAGQRVAFIAMEFVKGRELRDFFEANERFALKDVERLMGEILSALGHAHSHGVVHRDMKPANLIVLADGKVKVADFGIARIEKSELTQVGTVMGTPSYMSPEQFMGQTVDSRTDIFSCGVILYQFLTGEKPFTGNTTTIMYKVLNEEPLAPSMLNVALPPAFDAVVKKAMAKSPVQRYQTAEEFFEGVKAAVASHNADQTVINLGNTLGGDATAVNTGVTRTTGMTAAAIGTQTGRASAVAGPATVAAAAPAAPAKQSHAGLLAIAGVAGLLILGGGAYFYSGKTATGPGMASAPGTPVASGASTAPAAAPAVVAAAPSGDPVPDAGTMTISALGLVNPKDPKFNGDASAAQAEARADAKRQLVEKVLSLYIESSSIDKNYPVIEKKLLANYGNFIKTVIHEGAPETGKDGLLETETRAVLKVRDVQKSLNQLSKDERIDFIRNNGDPKVSIEMVIANADTSQMLPPARSQLAENVLKERIKSFGFRVWSNDGEVKAGPSAKSADFHIRGEAKFKQLSTKLAASGLTISKTVLTSWTVKAIDKASGEEIYLNTVMPQGQSWGSEDLALGDIGKLMGDEFSKNFFLQHFEFGVRKTNLNIQGLPDAPTARLLLRELRGIRQVLDVKMLADTGRYQLQLAESSSSDVVQATILKPLNTKLGQTCFTLAGSSEAEINVSFASACADMSVRGKLETVPPAGLLSAPASRGMPLLKSGAAKTT
ncbi:serine/threonine protein kinase [Rhodoferax sp.]|uniref:serine/threonine protein kinase n=1 Tax=Rhodoferax sp. TaxID=50421 RepID=UPI0039B91FC0